MGKRLLLTFFYVFFILISGRTTAQNFIDTSYGYTVFYNRTYGMETDFAGNQRELKVNIAVPVNDTPPVCGRPLLLVIHGGAWLAGSKDDATVMNIIRQFAQRGYVAASVQYRLGMFHTDSYVHCNISNLGTPWDCLQMTDSSEWIRAWYRGVQDAKGALRYMIGESSVYNIDKRNVFVMGESAGGFIALGVAYLDDIAEKMPDVTVLADADPPNTLYEGPCIQTYGFDTSISSMQLNRPDLGPVQGTLNLQYNNFQLKGVGSIYGGVFNDLFSHNSYSTPPRLYMFHQPNDLMVPYNKQKILQGYSACAVNYFNCSSIYNRPYCRGSKGVADLIDSLSGQSVNVPQYLFESTSNTADCLAQISNPSSGGHQYDNMNLRLYNMATYFAPAIDLSVNCLTSAQNIRSETDVISIFPNPASGKIYVQTKDHILNEIQVLDVSGRIIFQELPGTKYHEMELTGVPNEIYFIRVRSGNQIYYRKLVFKPN